MIVFPEKFHPQASLWWRSPSAWQVQSTHTISGWRRSFVDKDTIDDVDILVVVIDIHIIFNGIIIDIYVDTNFLIYHNWLPRDPLSGHHFLLWRTDNMWSSDPEDRAIVYIRLRKLSRVSSFCSHFPKTSKNVEVRKLSHNQETCRRRPRLCKGCEHFRNPSNIN